METGQIFSKTFAFRLALTLTGISLVACSNETSKNNLDVLDTYEEMRSKTSQSHSHVEYCDNDIVKLTISSRGQLISRNLYLPRESIVHFKNRDNLNTYPLEVRVASACLTSETSKDCRSNSKIWGVNTSLVDTAERRYKGAISHRKIELTDELVDGLYVSKVKKSESLRLEQEKTKLYTPHNYYRLKDIVYTSFLPGGEHQLENLPSLYITYNSDKFSRAKRCKWMVFTDEGIRSSKASDCTDLSEWKAFVEEFDKLSNLLSASGRFAKACAK